MYKVKDIIGDILVTMFNAGEFRLFVMERTEYKNKKKITIHIEIDDDTFRCLEFEEDQKMYIQELRHIIELGIQSGKEELNG